MNPISLVLTSAIRGTRDYQSFVKYIAEGRTVKFNTINCRSERMTRLTAPVDVEQHPCPNVASSDEDDRCHVLILRLVEGVVVEEPVREPVNPHPLMLVRRGGQRSSPRPVFLQ